MEWRALLQQNNGYMIIVHHLLGVVFAESASHSHGKEPSSKTHSDAMRPDTKSKLPTFS